jgi:hypothetical protein
MIRTDKIAAVSPAGSSTSGRKVIPCVGKILLQDYLFGRYRARGRRYCRHCLNSMIRGFRNQFARMYFIH